MRTRQAVPHHGRNLSPLTLLLARMGAQDREDKLISCHKFISSLEKWLDIHVLLWRH